MEKRSSNGFFEILSNLSLSSWVMPYLGKMRESQHIYTRLCKTTNELWTKNVEQISFVILKDKIFKSELMINCKNFREGFDYLEKYQNYLSVRIDLSIEIIEELKRLHQFFDEVGGLPSNFFKNVILRLDKDDSNILLSNSMFLKYEEKGLDLNKICVNFLSRNPFLARLSLRETKLQKLNLVG